MYMYMVCELSMGVNKGMKNITEHIMHKVYNNNIINLWPTA